jgi:hypothetical protein
MVESEKRKMDGGIGEKKNVFFETFFFSCLAPAWKLRYVLLRENDRCICFPWKLRYVLWFVA